MRIPIIVTTLLLALVACSSAPPGPAAGAAAGPCTDYMTAMCQKTGDCQRVTRDGFPVTQDDKDAVYNDCIRGVDRDCAGAREVGKDYDRCLADMKAITCGQIWGALDMGLKDWAPASCSGDVLR